MIKFKDFLGLKPIKSRYYDDVLDMFDEKLEGLQAFNPYDHCNVENFAKSANDINKKKLKGRNHYRIVKFPNEKQWKINNDFEYLQFMRRKMQIDNQRVEEIIDAISYNETIRLKRYRKKIKKTTKNYYFSKKRNYLFYN